MGSPNHHKRDEIRTGRGVVLSIRLPNSLSIAVEKVAEREGNPMSATVRRLISIGLAADLERAAS